MKLHKTTEDLQAEIEGLKTLVGVMKNHIQRATETCIELEAMVIQERNKTSRYAAKLAEVTGQEGKIES